MRILLIFCSLALFGLFIPSGVFAQSQSPVSIELDIDIPLPPGIQAADAAGQPVPLPDPLKFKRNGKCYLLGCAEGDGCRQCTLYWKDRNGDGKVNPKMELRCRCNQDAEKECKIQVKEVPCQD